MAELIPAPFRDLVTRLHREPALQESLFELSRRRWYLPAPDAPDLSVDFHGHRAGNPSGPAAGPHTQMAQNLLLSYAAGARILELKTVQINDRLTIGRPCIDVTNVGYNIEWSQELLVDHALREYAAGAMLIEMFRRSPAHAAGRLDGAAGDLIHDLSVGYDLAGIRGEKVGRFLDGMRDAGAIIERLRGEIPPEFRAARDAPYETRLSDSITLSTFHGCPADEIERICEYLIGERDFNVIVKMNPPTLGRERLEHLLFDLLGYTELRVNPTAYDAVVPFEESIELCDRLTAFAARRGRRLGLKFSNTLEVLNHRDFFKPNEKVMYLSGQPLHVITMTLTDECRRRIGPDVPISFSAGIDQQNFPLAVACGFVPVTVSTDLLRPGGYGRLPGYLDALTREMRRVGAETIDEFILRRFAADDPRTPTPLGPPSSEGGKNKAAAVREAAVRNTTFVAEMARNDPRYRADANRKVPKRIDSHLAIFDCVTCDKCLPVCPNAANFTYPTPCVSFDIQDVILAPDGSRRPGNARRFAIDRTMQIACFAEFCNECGNCDTFCPEYGGPYIEKPNFFSTLESWLAAAPREGFVVDCTVFSDAAAPTMATDAAPATVSASPPGDGGRRRVAASGWIRGRMKGVAYLLTLDGAAGCNLLDDGVAVTRFDARDHQLLDARPHVPLSAEHCIDAWAYHTLRHLWAGVLDRARINQVNVRWLAV